MSNLKILTNMNKIISKLPIILPKNNNVNKTCEFPIGNIIKLKLSEPMYNNNTPEDIVQTFIYLFNNNMGKGMFFNIHKNKIHQVILFNNTNRSILSKNDINMAKMIIRMITNILKKHHFNVIFFINLCPYPVISNDMKTKMIPTISFSGSFNHNDIIIPLPITPKVPKLKYEKGILFLFEENNIMHEILNKVTEIKNHPSYKNHNINYIIVKDNNIIKSLKCNSLYKTIVVICNPHVPLYYQYITTLKCNIILIENKDYYSYYSKLLIPNVEYIQWTFENWNDMLDNYVYDKNIFINNTMNIKEKYIGFLEHLQLNYNTNYITIKNNDIIQLDTNKYFMILHNNYMLLRCWYYRLNPLYTILSKFESYHYFIPQFILLALRTFPKFTNLHWISNRRVLLDNVNNIINSEHKINTFNHIIKNADDILNLNIINDDTNVYYIEIDLTNSDFSKWENSFIDTFNIIIQFIILQPVGSSYIIRTCQFFEHQTISLIQKFCSQFESVKIIKDKYFEPYMPYRYIVGINRIKNSNIKPIDIIEYNMEYYKIETNSMYTGIQFIKSTNNVVKDNMYVDNWIRKNIN
jgi:hypothetical protein